MKKTITILSSLLCLNVFTAQGADESRFRAGEWDLSPFATYVDKEDDKWGVGIAGTYYLNKSFGIGASTYWTDFSGTLFDNAAAEAYFRIPILESLSPYAVGSVGKQFDAHEWFETIGAGIDFRPLRNIAAFSDLQWRFANESKDGVFLRLGVRLHF